MTQLSECRYCHRVFEKPQSCGGHVVRCESNPKRTLTIQRTGEAGKGRQVTQKTRDQLSATVNAKIAAGTWHNSFAHARRHEYAGELFDGTWELKLAQWFDQHGIQWERNKKTFPYVFEERVRSYTPDFYMPAADCFVEVKGWRTAKDIAKWNCFESNLIVLSGSDLQKIGLDITVANDWRQLP